MSLTCALCHVPLPPSALLLQCTVRCCLLCTVLERQRSRLALSATRKPSPSAWQHSEHILSRETATTLIVAWAEKHDGRLPETRDLAHDVLPGVHTIKRLWGSLTRCRQALCREYPHLYSRTREVLTAETILAQVAQWHAAHHRLPLSADFRQDRTLPSMGRIYVHFGGLRQFYALFAAGAHADGYRQAEDQARSEKGRSAALIRRQREVVCQ